MGISDSKASNGNPSHLVPRISSKVQKQKTTAQQQPDSTYVQKLPVIKCVLNFYKCHDVQSANILSH